MTRVVAAASASLSLGPGERGEVVLDPGRPLRDPVVLVEEAEGLVLEEVVVGHTSVASGKWPARVLAGGLRVGRPVTPGEGLKLVIANEGPAGTTASATLAELEEV